MTNAHMQAAHANDLLVPIVPDVPLWNETMAVFLNDGASGVSAMFYIGRWWGKPTMLRAMIAIALPDGRVLFVRGFGCGADPTLPEAAGLRMLPCGDGSIVVDYDGPMDLRDQNQVARMGFGYGGTVRVTVDLTFRPLAPVWVMNAQAHEESGMAPMFPDGHREQIGRLDGTITIEDDVHRVSQAYAVRDHSRGARDYDKHQGHLWLNAWFPSGWGFYGVLLRVTSVPGIALNAGMICRGDSLEPTTLSTDGLDLYRQDIWRLFDVTLGTGAAARPLRVTAFRNSWQLAMISPADPHWGVPVGDVGRPAMWAQEQSVQVECDGEIGAGHIERSDRSVLADDRWRAIFART